MQCRKGAVAYYKIQLLNSFVAKFYFITQANKCTTVKCPLNGFHFVPEREIKFHLKYDCCGPSPVHFFGKSLNVVDFPILNNKILQMK